jgi:hypothetical protein
VKVEWLQIGESSAYSRIIRPNVTYQPVKFKFYIFSFFLRRRGDSVPQGVGYSKFILLSVSYKPNRSIGAQWYNAGLWAE